MSRNVNNSNVEKVTSQRSTRISLCNNNNNNNGINEFSRNHRGTSDFEILLNRHVCNEICRSYGIVFDSSTPSIATNLIENDQNRNETIDPDNKNNDNNNNTFLRVRNHSRNHRATSDFEILLNRQVCNEICRSYGIVFDSSTPSIATNLIDNDQNRNEPIDPDNSKNDDNNFLRVRKFEIEFESDICKQEINEYKTIDHVNQFISSSTDIYRIDGDSFNIINNNRLPEIKTQFVSDLSNENVISETEIKCSEYPESILNYLGENSLSNWMPPISDNSDNVYNLRSRSEYSNNNRKIVDSDNDTFCNSSGSEYVDSDEGDSEDDSEDKDYDDYVKVHPEYSHNNNTNTTTTTSTITTTTFNNKNNTSTNSNNNTNTNNSNTNNISSSNWEMVKNLDNGKQIDPPLGFVSTLICLYATNNNVDYENGLKINGDYLLPLLALDEGLIGTTTTTSIIDRSYINNKVKSIVNVNENRIRRRRFKTLIDRYRCLYDFLLPERKINYDDISDILRTILPYDFTDNNFEFKFSYYRYRYRTIKQNRLILIVGRKYILMAFDNDTVISNKSKLILIYDKAIIDKEQWWTNLNNAKNNRLMLVPGNIRNRRRLDNIKLHSLRYYTLKDEIRDICRLFHERLPRRDRYRRLVKDDPDLNRLINYRKLIICRSYRDGAIGVSFSSYKFRSSIRSHVDDSTDSSYTVIPVQRMCLFRQEFADTNEYGQQKIYLCHCCKKCTTDKSEMYNHWITKHQANLMSLSVANTYCKTIDIPQHFLKNKFASIIYPRSDTQEPPIDRSLVFISLTKNPIQFSWSIRSTNPVTVCKPALAYKRNSNEKSVLKTIYECPHCHKQLEKFHTKSRSYICPHCCGLLNEDDALHVRQEKHYENIYDQRIKCRTNNCDDTREVQSLNTAVQDYPNNQHNATYLKIFLDGCYKYKCLICSAIMNTEKTLKKHYKRIHSEPIYECTCCTKKVATLDALRKHIESVHSRRYVCSQCPKAFGTLQGLSYHEMSVHSSGMKYLCGICGKNMKHSRALTRPTHNDALYIYVEKHRENDKQIKCGTNNSDNTKGVQSFNITAQVAASNQYNATYSKIFMEGCYKYQCLICSAIMKTEQTMKKHYQRIHSELIYECTRCPKKVATLGALRKHIKSVHSRCYVCSQCPKGFGDLSGLKRHEMSVHSSEKKCMCDICGKKMKHSRSLAWHKNRMHNFIPKSCTLCNRLCTSDSMYIQHTRFCGKKKVEPERCICDICKKSFYSKQVLKNHMNQHLNVKPFRCNVCRASFSSRNYLVMHKWVHRDKLFCCPVCNKAFNRNDNMKTHLRTQHSNEKDTNLHADECVDDPNE